MRDEVHQSEVIVERRGSAGIIRLVVRDGHVAEIGDYHHCPWVLEAADEVRLA